MSSQYLNRPAILCLLLPAALLAETEGPYEFTVEPVSFWHSGVLTWESCGWNFGRGCSRISYPREFATHGVAFSAKKSGSSLEWGVEVTGTGRRIAQPSIRDEDWSNAFGLTRRGPRLEVQRLTLRDTPYSFEGGQKTNDAYAEAGLNQYAVLGSVRWAIGQGFALVGQAGYQHSDYRRSHAVASALQTQGRWSYPQEAAPDFGSFTVNLSELRAGFSYFHSLIGPLSVRVSVLPALGYAASRDDHGFYSPTIFKMHTWGGGGFADAVVNWRLGDSVEVGASGWAHHLYTRGVQDVVGSRTYFIQTRGATGQDINLKERGGSLRISVRL